MALNFDNIHDDEFDNSKLDCYAFCHRQYYYEHVLRIATIGCNTDMAYGSALHDAQKVYWNNEQFGIEEAVEKAVLEFTLLCADIPPKGAKDIHTGVELLREFYRTNRITGKPVTVEKRIWRTMKNGSLKYFGTADLVTRKQDNIIGYDWKTTGRLMSNTFTRWASIEPQFIGYQWLCGATEFWVVCFHFIKDKKKQRIYYVPCYFSPKQVDIWLLSAEMGMCEIWNKVKISRQLMNGTSKGYMLDALWPTRGPRCKMMGCGYMDLCCKGEALHELYVPDTLYRFKEELR